ncbi:1-(5-phosphoribosyl)-5-[(5-phosphoribosylamino)methylideneamino]imidazole-4-carboxamide isomerase [Robertkochia marina]|uniref:1-(5-phosphoribosyl)-5-[(5-phosphoribosylamino)methylideneamino] imidazole-4-carboxamide isomerase n=1 Tax=Robertkochia marina TaxID=1227945 RepID=A0A4S3M1L6_9FLAO|nr:1-(5-phosphoribosyl)-5-[(5-phosphoribosylamino)methylideneamino]imidazole-4-carboxamide isomerase [Robertkochia marina]THD67923.1 1-(5-phosphoribosyl)-5-[(5-phosphoribosylamino)methylideneamino]imidazole-4-carboxamide isomerase [Robertkochia marina]TRZ41029.1 1-(5-phosphoribosyl)-5-[(5-phosphoribosylamino)methylideneamino]imidazole-4-carboxamide isomerase [Robertkochia marina]
MRIIPAIDLIEGKCVRLSQGDYNSKKVYNEDPLEVARMFEDHGIEHLHLVDLDGAKAKKVINYKVLEGIASTTSLKIDFGGGIRSDEDLHIAFNSGAKQITGGSIAVHERDTFLNWVATYGVEKIILGADAREGKIAVSGWTSTSELDLIPFIKNYLEESLQYVICTDISKDGLLQGPSFELYTEIIKACPKEQLRLIASGGVTQMDDLYRLKEIGCEGAIIGKAFYEGKISLKDLERFISEQH